MSYTSEKPALKYRPEIDGLRTIAVLSVFFFHAGSNTFSGGFVGVDVFFVISGFLITSLILSDRHSGKFTIGRFYERRARRILPALLIVLAVCSVCAWFVLLPIDLKHYAESLGSTILFASNFYFKNRTGYFFEGEADISPLLHTWSLAIEEQFYILFPLLLAVVYRYIPRHLRAILAFTGLISLCFSIWWVKIDQDNAFYLLPFRGWELLLGALLATQPVLIFRNKYAGEISGIAGLALILVSVFFYNRHIEFPGLSAVVPCVGTFLIIASNSVNRNLVGRFLSLRPVVFFGLISYPFYLWHWPMIVFLKYQQGQPLAPEQVLVVFILTTVLSVLTFYFIENPVRHRKVLTDKKPLITTAIAISGFMIITGLTTMAFSGFPGRIDANVARFASAKEDIDLDTDKCFQGNNMELLKKDELCRIGNTGKANVDFILWGDSHADAIYPAIKSMASRSGLQGVFTGSPACPPMLGVNRLHEGKFCAKFNAAVVNYIKRKQIKTVILAARWDVNILGRTDYELQRDAEQIYLQDDESTDISLAENSSAFERGITRLFRDLQQNGNRIWLVLQVPNTGLKTPYYLARKALLEKQPEEVRLDLAQMMKRHQTVLNLFTKMQKDFDFNLIDPAGFLCIKANCLIAYQGYSLYRDDDHLSKDGALLLQDIFSPIFNQTTGALEY